MISSHRKIVRTAAEASRGRIAGFVHIPLDQLRDQMSEIPEGKSIYVRPLSQRSGSYIACRILMGNGYDCYNLAGGRRLYESVQHDKTVPEFICTECK